MLKGKLLSHLDRLMIKEGKAKDLIKASTGEHYKKVWIRDTVFCILPSLQDNPEQYVKTIQRLLDLCIYDEMKHYKFASILKNPNKPYGYEYLHPRCDDNLEEINEEWGFKQNDCLGEILYAVYLGESAGLKIIRDFKDEYIINQIIKVLAKLEYWHDPDNGIWEENEEVHASSVGACVAGLQAIRYCGFEVPQYLIDKGYETLNELLPRESVTKSCDLALLTLIYPYNLLDVSMAQTILSNVEKLLLRERGVIRYIGDMYYNPEKLVGKEAEWCFGIAYLSLAYNNIGEFDKANYYYQMLLDKCVLPDGEVPELYYGHTNVFNDNTPLGWSVAMTRLTQRIVGGIK